MNITELIKSYPDYIGGKGSTEEEILTAEITLNLSFAEDFRMYLSQIGVACFDSREFTGICNISRINVVEATVYARKYYDSFPLNMYVVENTCFDGVLILQSSDGKVYKKAPQSDTYFVAESLFDYLQG